MPAPSDVCPPDADVAQAEAGIGPPFRLCGRCRQPSVCDPDDPTAAMVAWFLCQPCRVALLGNTGRGRQAPIGTVK